MASRSWRLSTTHGPVYVWRPDVRPSAIVVYVHGYYDDVDTVWTEHRLSEQFAASRRAALFIVPEAQRGVDDPIPWSNLAELLASVSHLSGQPTEKLPIIAIGHSGAFANLSRWLAHPRLQTVILLDALYGDVDKFRDWAILPGHRLVLVGHDATPLAKSDKLASELDAVRRSGIPIVQGFTPTEAAAKVLFVRSQYDHFGIVRSGHGIAPFVAWAIPTATRRWPGIAVAAATGLFGVTALVLAFTSTNTGVD